MIKVFIMAELTMLQEANQLEIATSGDLHRTVGTVEAAKILNVGTSTVQRWIDRGLITSFRTPGGHRRITKAELLAFAALRGSVVGHGGKRCDVVVVDDDEIFVQFMKDLIETLRPDLLVHTSINGFEAGLSIMRERPVMVFLDVAMPTIDGSEVCRVLKNSVELSSTRVIAMTGRRDSGLIGSMIKAGVEQVLLKPITAAMIEPVLSSIEKRACAV